MQQTLEQELGPGKDMSAVGADATAKADERWCSALREAPATYVLLAINFLIFIWMAFYGPIPELWHSGGMRAVLIEPFDYTLLLRFGGCEGQAVLDAHQWWRVLTATFLHVNPLHLLVNMWCLWNLGLLGEPLLGKQGVVATYILTGVAGNLLSLMSHVLGRTDLLVAGASGAIFGIAGILIVLLSNRKLALPWNELRGLRRSVVVFALLNLLIGIGPQLLMAWVPGALSRIHLNLTPLAQIDNTSHLGGLLCGLAMGFPLFPRMMDGRVKYRARQAVTFACAAAGLVGFGALIELLHRSRG